jgi:hypothetical protein
MKMTTCSMSARFGVPEGLWGGNASAFSISAVQVVPAAAAPPREAAPSFRNLRRFMNGIPFISARKKSRVFDIAPPHADYERNLLQ